ncbi:MAG TPA: hypothetical protein DEB39_11610 [Planctomycetaceae bacterium]|nr:hypothetical protein [Planctomycetaceae bacterium]
MKTFFSIFFLSLLAVVAGCSKKVSVEGRVTFPDGAPLTVGTVVFEMDHYQVVGPLDQDGRYRLGEIRPGDGVLRGRYGVRVHAETGGTSDGAPIVKYVAPKYENTETSELSCEIKGKTVFDFTVERP